MLVIIDKIIKSKHCIQAGPQTLASVPDSALSCQDMRAHKNPSDNLAANTAHLFVDFHIVEWMYANQTASGISLGNFIASVLLGMLLKIWFDILTPKQLLFFESMVTRLKKEGHDVLCTSRKYREATELAKIRNFHMDSIGKHGGSKLDSKLDAGISRMGILSRKIQKFKPDITISFCSPDASRVAFGLGIPHIGFCNAPHSQMIKLSIALLAKLLIPSHICKQEFTRFGIHPKDVIRYNAMDEIMIVTNKIVSSKLPAMNLGKRKTILFRTYEVQASYFSSSTDIVQILDALIKNFPDCNLVVIGRYVDEINALRKKYAGQHIIILDKVVDSRAILSVTDLFVGSGGTMTTEAVLYGIPSIAYDMIPRNLDAKYLIKKKLLVRVKTARQAVLHAKRLLSQENTSLTSRAQKFASEMDDPFLALKSAMKMVEHSK